MDQDAEDTGSSVSNNLSNAVRKLLGTREANILTNITTWQGKPISPRNHFFDVLNSWESFISLNNMWMVFFKIPELISDEVMKEWGEHILDVGDLKDTGSTNTARKLLIKPKHQEFIGCAFAQTISVPAEEVTVGIVGPTNRGFLKGPVIHQRADFAPLGIEFFESTVSFTDFLIRPWVILNSHYGLIARDNQNLKLTTDVVLINFARTGTEFAFDSETDPLQIRNKRGFIPRKLWLFSGCTPTSISSERYSHDTDNTIERRDTTWIFKRYQILLPTFLESEFNKIEENEKTNSKEFWTNSKQSYESQLDTGPDNKIEKDTNEADQFWKRGETVNGEPHPILSNYKQQSSQFYPNEQIGKPEATLSPHTATITSQIMSKMLWGYFRPDLNISGDRPVPGREAYDIQLAARTNSGSNLDSISNSNPAVRRYSTSGDKPSPGDEAYDIPLEVGTNFGSNVDRISNSNFAVRKKSTDSISGQYSLFGDKAADSKSRSIDLNTGSRLSLLEKIIPPPANIGGRPRYDIFGILGF